MSIPGTLKQTLFFNCLSWPAAKANWCICSSSIPPIYLSFLLPQHAFHPFTLARTCKIIGRIIVGAAFLDRSGRVPRVSNVGCRLCHGDQVTLIWTVELRFSKYSCYAEYFSSQALIMFHFHLRSLSSLCTKELLVNHAISKHCTGSCIRRHGDAAKAI